MRHLILIREKLLIGIADLYELQICFGGQHGLGIDTNASGAGSETVI